MYVRGSGLTSFVAWAWGRTCTAQARERLVEGPVEVAPPALVLLPFTLAPKAPSIGMLAGMNGYLSKPVNLEDLRQAIETMIKNQ